MPGPTRFFTLPVFNITCNIFRFARGSGGSPPTGTPDATPPCNFGGGFRTWVNATVTDNEWVLLPWGTDIRDGVREGTGQPDWVEVPAGSGNWYVVQQVLFYAVGFPNAHYGAIVAPGATGPPQPVPYNGPPVPPAPSWTFDGLVLSGGVVADYFVPVPNIVGSYWVIVWVTDAFGLAPTLYNEEGGSFTALVGVTSGATGGDVTGMYLFSVATAGATSNIHVVLTNPATSAAAVFHSTTPSFDEAGFTTTTGLPIATQLSSPTANPNSLILTAVAIGAGTIPAAVDNVFPIGNVHVADYLDGDGNQWVIGVAFRVAVPIGDLGDSTWSDPGNVCDVAAGLNAAFSI